MKRRYIFDENKDSKIFSGMEKIIDKENFPIMSGIAKEEIKNVLKSSDKGTRFIEIGCGSGRVLKKIAKRVNVFGTDINNILIKKCLKDGLRVFQLNMFKDVPIKHKEKYDIAFMSYNTFYNFSKKERLRIIGHVKKLLKPGGKYMFTVFSNNNISNEDKEQINEYYRKVINPEKEFAVKFINKNKERGFGLISKGKVLWFSRWRKEREIEEESLEWKGFKRTKILPYRNKRGYFVVLRKNKLSA